MSYWSTDVHKGKGETLESRKWLGRPKLRLGASDRSIVIGTAECGVSEVSTDPVSIRIRRRGHRGDESWLLEYPAFDADFDGRTRFILDSQITALADGRYEAQVMQGCDVCGTFEIELDKSCALDVTSAATVRGEIAKVINGEIPNVTDIFQEINTLSVNTCAILEATDTRLPLAQADKDALCALVLCRGVELMLTDGVKSEVVLFSGCANGEVEVTRAQAGTSAARFPIGTDLCFTWTSNNVTAAAEGCL